MPDFINASDPDLVHKMIENIPLTESNPIPVEKMPNLENIDTSKVMLSKSLSLTSGTIRRRKGWDERGEVEDASDEPTKKMIGVSQKIFLTIH